MALDLAVSYTQAPPLQKEVSGERGGGRGKVEGGGGWRGRQREGGGEEGGEWGERGRGGRGRGWDVSG